jgi:hypothetical protein
MKDGYTKGDEYASILIRAAHLISGYLGSIIHVIHCPRRSSWESKMVDNFTREKITSFLEQQILSRYRNLKIPAAITSWMNNPTNDWDLPMKLLYHVMSMTESE